MRDETVRNEAGVPEEKDRFYREMLATLSTSGIPFLVGGAFALARHGGVKRDTKDLDVFVMPQDCRRVLQVFERRGFHAELTFEHWLGKVKLGDHLLDVIFSSGNGLCTVDELWFRHSVEDRVMGFPVSLIPPEEMIWSKGTILERDRFDGADILHVLRLRGRELDWDRLLWRFGPHWRILLAHLLLFEFVYPSQKDRVPRKVLEDLLERARKETGAPPAVEKLCRGTLLSHGQYRPDIDEWGFIDARLPPHGKMTPEQVETWQASFEQKAKVAGPGDPASA